MIAGHDEKDRTILYKRARQYYLCVEVYNLGIDEYWWAVIPLANVYIFKSATCT